MTLLIQNVLQGLCAGSVYALLAVGIVLVYKSSEVLNFAHGAFAMLATFVGYHLSVNVGLGPAPSLAGALLFAFVLGAAAYRTLIDRAREGGAHAMVLITIGLLMITEGVAGAIWGTDTKEFHHVFADAGSMSLPGGLMMSSHDAWILAVALLLVALLAVFFRVTRVGIGLRAVAQNEVAARLFGVRVARVHALTWGIATALGGIAGLLLTPKLFLDPSMMFAPLLKAFAAAVLGGMNSVAGAIAGAWLLGIIETLAGAYISTEFQATLAFVIIIVVLALRPDGLFGKPEAKKV